MRRTDRVMKLLRGDAERGKQFTVIGEDEERLILRSQATMGKTETPLSMLMIVRNGSNFSDIVARICSFDDQETAERMMQYANFIQNNYSGVRAGIQVDEEDEEFSFYMSIENYFDENDDNAEQLFYLDGYLTHAISEEYDNIMRVLYA